MRTPKKERERFVKVSELRIPMVLEIDFDRPVPVREARQIARRILDHTAIDSLTPIENEAFAEAKIKCNQLQRLLPLERKAESEPRSEIG